MAELTRVPAPRSPFDGWRGRVVSLVVIGIAVAAIKPWGAAPSADLASPHPSTVSVAPPVVIAPIGRIYDPSAFASDTPPDAWAIVTAANSTPLDFIDRAGPATSAAPDSPDPATASGPPIVSGPVVDLGTTDDLTAFAIVHPRDTTLETIRIWQFRDGASPRRVDVDDLPSPWPVDHVAVVARRLASMDAGRVLAWEPGLYRLDLLVEPEDVVRSVMLTVRAGASGSGGTASRDAEPTRTTQSFRPSTLRMLPEAANLWSSGRILSGWRRDEADATCGVAEIWRATDPDGTCWPVPLGRTAAVGVNLQSEVVTSIRLLGIDPLPGPVDAEARLEVDGLPGRAMVRAPAGGLPDGIFRLDVGLEEGTTRTWYLEVGPIGRAVAQYYEASASR
jgi:hypothetical protein